MNPPRVPGQPEPKGQFEFTRDEIKSIEKAMQQEEFRDMLGDYMMEISDPANKEEYDRYLYQMENENELPKDMRLIQPDAEFAIKTKLSMGDSNKFTEKVFINISSHNWVTKPSSENTPKGQHWKMPYSVSKLRYDQDKKKRVVTTVDVVFHKEAFKYAHIDQFTKFLCDTALNGVERLVIERKQKISKDYIILKNMKCKGGKPAVLPINIRDLTNAPESEKRKGKGTERGRNPDTKTKLERELLEQKEKAQKEKMASEKNEEAPLLENEEEEEPPKKPEMKRHDNGLLIPVHKVVYSYPVVLSDYMNSREVQERRIPDGITMTIELPDIVIAPPVHISLSSVCFGMLLGDWLKFRDLCVSTC